MLYWDAHCSENWGPTISLSNGKENTEKTQTGRLDRHTLLHKRYMILRTIGQGGMGAVYQARDLRRQSTCAIKEMSLSTVPSKERIQAVQNFKVEAKILSGLSHPNLPTFTGFFTEGTGHFLVMEYIDGMTLDALLERSGPIPERRVLGWARQLCDVLQYLHSQHPPIIFRDMKPGNIMLMSNGRVKLIDFGIARFFRQASSQDTQMLGTPGFAPPEQYGKAQTDERSDIYSLAMTLFQLLTNTLSEKGFGLKDVRSVNANISPTVARALEKATSLSPEDRYENVEAFRRALLGVGMFLFENGEQATTPEELADLCAKFPGEAGDYLFAGELESWFEEIDENDLARATMQIRAKISDPEEAVERLLQAVMGPSAHIRNYTSTMVDAHSTGAAPPGRSQSARGSRGWLSRGPTSDIIVEPQTINFGSVYPGISAPLSLAISGDRGALIRGSISPTEPWITVDATSFDGMSSRVNVRVNTSRLRGLTQYTGKIIITPEGAEDEEQDIVVKVLVDVLSYTTTSSMTARKGQGLPLEDEDDDLTIADQDGMVMVPRKRSSAGPTPNSVKYNEYSAKYGPATSTSEGWDPLPASAMHRKWRQHSFTVFGAFMLASLFYTLFSQLPFVTPKLPLPPNPWFIAVLLGSVPSATLGAFLVNWNNKDSINRICTGLSGALLTVGVGEFIWQSFIPIELPALQLIVMLLVTALGATIGSNAGVSGRILKGTIWAMSRVRLFTIALAVVIGGSLGYVLTTGFSIGYLPLIGVLLVGIAIALALVLRVDYLVKQHSP